MLKSNSVHCLLQLVDFLDVIDDPILGYTAPAVITVLHTHLATCAVDYRYTPKIMAKTCTFLLFSCQVSFIYTT